MLTRSGWPFVPDHRSLDPLDRHLHLPTARPDPGGRVLGDPVDDLAGGLDLGFVQHGRDLRMKRCGQGPGLGSVDGDLDEPQCVRVLAQPALPAAGVDVDASDPVLVGLPVHRAPRFNAVGCRDQALGDAAALTEVVVISSGSIPFDVGAGSLRSAAVPAMHADHPEIRSQRRPSTTNECPRNASWAARSRATHLPPS